MAETITKRPSRKWVLAAMKKHGFREMAEWIEECDRTHGGPRSIARRRVSIKRSLVDAMIEAEKKACRSKSRPHRAES